MKYKIGVYVRVSTDEQALRSEGSLETQKHRILGEIENRNRREGGFGKVVEVYEDDGYSAVAVRPAYQRLMRDVHSGKINLIFIADYFRLCRHLLDYLTLADRLKKIGARVLSVKDNFDTETAMGQSMIRTLINMAQTERELTAERVAINFHARALRGLRNGGRVLYGFDRIEDDLARLKVNDSEAAEIREVFRVYIEEGTLARAVDRLNESGPFRKTKSYKSSDVVKTEKWNRMTLNMVLRNPAYRGMREINRENKGKDQETLKEVERYQIVKASWPAIIGEADWSQVQEMLDHAGSAARARLATKTRREYPLTSVFTCAECGRAIMGASGHGRKSVHRYYVHRKLKGQKIACSMNWIPADDIEPKVFAVLDRILEQDGYLDTLEDRFRSNVNTQRADLEREKSTIEASVSEIDREIKSTIQVQTRTADPSIDDVFREQLRELADKKRMETVRLSEIQNRLDDLPDPKAAREAFRINAQAFKKAFAKSNEATRKRLVASVFERISFNKFGLELYLNPHIASAEAVQILQKEKSSELRSEDSSLYSNILIFNQQVRKKKTAGPFALAGWDQAVDTSSIVKIGRGDRIRTCDPLVPNQMRYQTALLPESSN